MKIFKLAKDFALIGDGIIPKDTELQLNDNGKYYLMSGDFQMGFTLEQVESDAMFKEVKSDIKVEEVTEEVAKEDREVVKKWRIQLDIVTTESKRQEMQKEIEKIVKEINERV
jgi:hypothetical protein